MPRKINDHSFWAGGKSNGSVFPMGAKVKAVSGVEGAGKLNSYCDTAPEINRDQMAGVRKLKGQSMKEGYRN